MRKNIFVCMNVLQYTTINISMLLEISISKFHVFWKWCQEILFLNLNLTVLLKQITQILIYCCIYDSIQDIRSNKPICFQEVPRAFPLGTLSGKGVYLTIYPLSRPYTDTVFSKGYSKKYLYICTVYSRVVFLRDLANRLDNFKHYNVQYSILYSVQYSICCSGH